MSGDDFVEVRLTEFGQALAAGNPVRVNEGVREFVFTPGQAQRVTVAYDWQRVLSQLLINGRHLFEVVPAAEPEHEQDADRREPQTSIIETN